MYENERRLLTVNSGGSGGKGVAAGYMRVEEGYLKGGEGRKIEWEARKVWKKDVNCELRARN